MATKDWNGFKKNGDTYIPNDATARAGLQNKVDKVSGKGLSTNDYSNADKAIVDGVTSALSGKVDKVAGKGLSTNDYDDTEKAKVAGAFPRSEQAVLGAKNLLKLTNDSQTVQTVSVEVDKAAGKVTLNGTNATGSPLYKTIASLTSGDTALKHGMQVIFSGYNNVNAVMYINGLKQDDTYTYNVANSSPDLHEQSFIVDWTTYKRYDVGITLRNNVTYNNDVLYPMIRLASDSDTTFTPYAMTNRELTEIKESSVTLTVEATVNESRGGNHLYKNGKMVQMTLTLEGLSRNAYQTFANIPEGYKPIQTITALPTLRTDHKIVISKAGQVQSADNLDNVNIDIYAIWMVQ